MAASIPDASATLPAFPDQWKHTGVRVVPGDSLDTQTAQTPGMLMNITLVICYRLLKSIWA